MTVTLLRASRALIVAAGALTFERSALERPPVPTGTNPLPVAEPNANGRASGELRGGVLRIRLDARMALWHPDGDSLPGIAIEAFEERGKRPQVPGPLVRVPRGTEIRASIRNALDRDTLTFHLPTGPAGATDSVAIPPGESRELRVRAERPGTYLYHAVTSTPVGRLLRVGGLLAGAVIVDSAASPSRDRVFVLQTAADTADAGGEPRRAVHAVNGRTWPHTERIAATVGDTVRWRVINVSSTTHPMHLHGFYYRVDALDGPRVAREGQGAPGRMVVTERMSPFSTMAITWVPERPGNWLFHCHFQEHVVPHGVFNGTARSGERQRIGPSRSLDPARDHATHVNHALTGMSGPVTGVHVAARRNSRETRSTPGAERQLRLVAIQEPEFPDSQPSMRFVVEDPATGRRIDAGRGISPTLDLARDQAVAITVVNRMREDVAVHWHGIELESYFDGVAGFSGLGARVTPSIAPNDSFVARFTPPRAGTFMYHSHVEEPRHHRGGLLGALLVRDPTRPDSAQDLVFVFKAPRLGGLASGGEVRATPVPIEINGRADPDTIVMRVGRRYRLRLIGLPTGRPNTVASLTARPDSAAALERDSMLVTWLPVAKDGADLPPAARVPTPARQFVSMGETFDFEFSPERTGLLRLEIRAGAGGFRLLGRAPIQVRSEP